MHPDELSKDVVSRARATLSPTAADQARVWASIGAAIATPGAPGGEGVTRAGSASRESPAGRGLRAWTAKRVVGAALAAAVVAGASGAVGYRLGLRVGRGEGRRDVAGTSGADRNVDDGAVGRPSAIATPEAVAGTAPRVPVEPMRPSAPTLDGGRAARASASGRGPGGGRAPAAASLDAEVRALRSVERALRDQQPRLALALLRELDAAVPDGKLREEREATSTIARCLAGEVPFDVNLARDFAEHHSGSVYQRRIEQACVKAASGTDE
jgi:hypothetical protein